MQKLSIILPACRGSETGHPIDIQILLEPADQQQAMLACRALSVEAPRSPIWQARSIVCSIRRADESSLLFRCSACVMGGQNHYHPSYRAISCLAPVDTAQSRRKSRTNRAPSFKLSALSRTRLAGWLAGCNEIIILN